MTRPKFLTLEDITDLRRNTCVFCYTTFESDHFSYHLDFTFNEQSLILLKEMEQETYEKTKEKKEREIEETRKTLTRKLSRARLSKEHIHIAVNSIISDSENQLIINPLYGRNPLEMRISNVFYALKLGDLKILSPELKSHRKCWPLNHFDGDVSFNVPYTELFHPVMHNPRFEDYNKQFEEFPEILDLTNELHIMLSAQAPRYPSSSIKLKEAK